MSIIIMTTKTNIYEPEYYTINDIDNMINDYNKNFEKDCIYYSAFYYKFSLIMKECRIKEYEKLKENIRFNPNFMIKP